MLRFGQPVRDLIGAPGLYAKVPFIDTVVYIDKRILALDNERQEVLVADNQRLEVDAFVRYRIADPLLFYQSVFNVKGANAQLGGMLNSALRRTLSEASIVDIVRDKRDALMADIRDQVQGGRRALRPRGRRRAHQARRPAAGEFRGGVPPHAGRAPAARRDVPRAGLAAEPADQGRRRRQGDGDDRRRPSSSPTRSAARATASATAFSPRPTARTPSSSPSIARCRPMRPAFKGDTRAILSPKSDFFRYFSTPTPPTPASGADGGRRRRRTRRRRSDMRDFGAAIGLVFAIEGLLLAGFTETMRKRMAEVARQNPGRLALASASARRCSGCPSSGPRERCFSALGGAPLRRVTDMIAGQVAYNRGAKPRDSGERTPCVLITSMRRPVPTLQARGARLDASRR